MLASDNGFLGRFYCPTIFFMIALQGVKIRQAIENKEQIEGREIYRNNHFSSG